VPTTTVDGVTLGQWLIGTEFVYGRGASGASWTEPRCHVTAVAPGSAAATLNISMDQPCWSFATNKGTQSVKHPSDIENAVQLLNTPGEWFGDWANGTLYYVPLPGQQPDTIVAVLGTVSAPTPPDQVETVAAIRVLSGAQRLDFTGISVEHVTWLQPSGSGGFVDLQSGFFFTRLANGGNGPLHGVPGAMWLSGVKDVVIQNCTFAHLGLTGIVADGGSQRINITSSTFADLSGSAVSLGNVSQANLPPPTQDQQFLVESNIISFTGQEYRGCAGVFAGYVALTSINYNAISDTSNGAVCIGWGWGATNTMQQNSVSYNHITRSNTVLFDCGSVYTLSAQPNSEVCPPPS
jgi:hypothetical protein